jgi:hypothetical protein
MEEKHPTHCLRHSTGTPAVSEATDIILIACGVITTGRMSLRCFFPRTANHDASQ